MTTSTVPATAFPVRDDTRNDPARRHPPATCLLCAAPRLSGRGRYCSAACRQRAFRLRHTALPALEDGLLRNALRRRATLKEHTVYECPVCETRTVGEQRCPDCNRFCRVVGLGGACSDCEQPVVLSELLDLEVDPM
ncbi:MAG: hypothetical protein ACRDI2_08360 [Chloroflexota bacterium]